MVGRKEVEVQYEGRDENGRGVGIEEL